MERSAVCREKIIQPPSAIPGTGLQKQINQRQFFLHGDLPHKERPGTRSILAVVMFAFHPNHPFVLPHFRTFATTSARRDILL